MRTLVLLVLLVLGCEDDDPGYSCPDGFEPQYKVKQIWVDSECSEKARDAILDGADDLNDFTREHLCQPILEVVGELQVDHETKSVDTDVPVIVCYGDIPSWWYGSSFDESNLIGFSSSIHGLRFFLFRRVPVAYGTIHHLMLHEAMHFIGLRGHHSGDGIMTEFGIVKSRRVYTLDDTEFFCDNFDCIN